MAILSIIVGLIILHTISREKARRQRQEINLQKILGASFSDLKNLVRLEFGALWLFLGRPWDRPKFRIQLCTLSLHLRPGLEFSLATPIDNDYWSYPAVLLHCRNRNP